ncbi:hypothetical protein GCM10025862_09710 [Arsenicicoccus piscis]|uniref:UDP-N-acetylmuramate--L-alanine ligase n=1 Tax=Arsenicicoccus piscis TaxID=673954 RepID=A0ABQ6HLG8_9MICO|nr:hypothetical protein GCM10025862_09710 [Arsenicicoccus piscis]
MRELSDAGIQVLHVTGRGKAFDPVDLGTGAPYVVREYVDRMDLAYAAADLVVSRAGAGMVCELTAVGLPAIYVPLPIGNGEQRFNVTDVVGAGGGWSSTTRRSPRSGSARCSCRSSTTATGSPRWRRRPPPWGTATATNGSPTWSRRPRRAPPDPGRGPMSGLPATRFDFEGPVPSADELGRVHLIAIGGAGVSGVARLLLARGLAVSGSDAKDSPLLDALRAEGATVHVGHDPVYLDGVDTVVVSSAIREDNVELAHARALGLPVLHRSQALAAATQGQRVAAVAGANGKTTTTSMLTVALQGCGVDPSFAIGGELAKAATNAHGGSGPDFVVEADESDGSFLVYHPTVAVVTNVQPDHLDHYGTFEQVKAAYLAFARSIRPGGLLVACADDAGSRELAERARADGLRVLTYGEAEDADVRVSDIRSAGFAVIATLHEQGSPTAR